MQNIKNGLVRYFREFWKYRDLLKLLVTKNIKLKYRRSWLGYVWSVLNPLLIMVVMTVVFSTIFKRNIENFPVYLFVGILLGVITTASRSVIPAMLLHLLNNTLSIFTSDQFLSIIMQKNGAFFVGFLLAVLFGMSLFLFLYCIELQYVKFTAEPPVQSLPPKNRTHFTKVFFSPAFLILVAVFLLF